MIQKATNLNVLKPDFFNGFIDTLEKKDSKKLFNSLDIEPEETTSIHVRRGDFLKRPLHHPVQPPEYYIEAIKYTKNKNYLFFSDDVEWCKRSFKNNKDVYFSEDNNPFVDLYSMSKCKHNIIVNSSFIKQKANYTSNYLPTIIC